MTHARYAIARFVVVCLAMLPASARGEEAIDSSWQFRVSPYVWLPSFSTSASVEGSPDAEGDTSLIDVLDFAFMIHGEARKQRLGLLAEFNYLALSDDTTWGGADRFKAEASLTGVMGGAAASWRVLDHGRFAIDPLVGFRVWSIETEVDFDRLPTASKTATFVDPILGVRGGVRLSKRLSLQVLGEVGGFGAGSDLQYEAIGQVRYEFARLAGLSLGYRHLHLKFDDDGVELDATLSGPLLSVDLRF